MGTDDDFEQHAALWLAKLAGGVRWLGRGAELRPSRNPLPPGSSRPAWGRTAPASSAIRATRPASANWPPECTLGGGLLSVQMVLQGGMPIAPSNTLSSYADHRIPHALDLDEVQWLVREYGESAARRLSTWASTPSRSTPTTTTCSSSSSRLSPTSASDGYGGVARAAPSVPDEGGGGDPALPPGPVTLGFRLCLDELIEGGYDFDECAAAVAAFSAEATGDHFSLDVGNSWGEPSYISSRPGTTGQRGRR